MTATVIRPDLSTRTALSKSALVQFDLCQTASWFDLHQRRPLIPSERITFGSAIDAAVESCLTMARAGVPLEEARWLSAADEIAARDGIALNMEDIETAMDRFVVTVLPNRDFSYCRLQASITIDDPELGEINGHPDVILQTNDIRDVKTAKRAKPDEPTVELGLYAMLVEGDTGKPVPTVGYWTYVRVGRPYWQEVAFDVTDELRRWTYERAASYIRAKKADVVLNKSAAEPGNYSFPGGPRFPSLCGDCQYSPANGGPCLMAFRGQTIEEGAA